MRSVSSGNPNPGEEGKPRSGPSTSVTVSPNSRDTISTSGVSQPSRLRQPICLCLCFPRPRKVCRLPMGKFVGDLPGGRWVEVRIRLNEFHTASIYDFRPQYTQNIVFHQGRADGVRHTLIVDEFRIDDDAAPHAGDPLRAPENVHAIGYDRHVEVRWNPVNNPALGRYVIYRSLDGKSFEPIGIQLPGTDRYSDFLGNAEITAAYKVAASDSQYGQSQLSNAASASTREFDGAELLTMPREDC